MKLIELYRKAVELGMENDPRGRDRVTSELSRAGESFDQLAEKEKK